MNGIYNCNDKQFDVKILWAFVDVVETYKLVFQTEVTGCV